MYREIKDQELSSLSSMSETEILEQYDALNTTTILFFTGENFTFLLFPCRKRDGSISARSKKF